MEELVRTLTAQNKTILEEIESHAYTHEVVRTHLDRREEVNHLLKTFNRDLIESKRNLERCGSPLRQSSPYRQSASQAMSRSNYASYTVKESQNQSGVMRGHQHSFGGTNADQDHGDSFERVVCRETDPRNRYVQY